MAIPATMGDARTRLHSSGVNDAFDDAMVVVLCGRDLPPDVPTLHD
jgi:hypothetical protein